MKANSDNKKQSINNTVVIVLLLIVAILFFGRSYYIKWIDIAISSDTVVDSHLFSEELMEFTTYMSESIPTEINLEMARVEHDEKTINIYFEYVDSLEKANTIINSIDEFLSQNPNCIKHDNNTNIIMYMNASYERTVSIQLNNYSRAQGKWCAEINPNIINYDEELNDEIIVEMIQVVTITENDIDSSKIDLLGWIYPSAEIET